MHEHLDRNTRTPPSRHRAAPTRTPTPANASAPVLDARRLLELQRLAGNAGVLRALQRSEEGTEDDDYH